MCWKSYAAALTGRLGKRLVVGLVVAVLLMPTPAMALTFLGSWSAQINLSGGPLPPAPTFSDSLTNNGTPTAQDVLTVDMGDYQGATMKATSSIELKRNMQVTSASQLVTFMQDFTSQFAQAGVSSEVTVYDSNGRNGFTPVVFGRDNQSSKFVTFSAQQSANKTLTAGTYLLDVTVTYTTDAKLGAWKSISRHHFTFQGN